ncbi:MAG: hypothetical protein WAU45_12450 [Blastocatellia bacterium]
MFDEAIATETEEEVYRPVRLSHKEAKPVSESLTPPDMLSDKAVHKLQWAQALTSGAAKPRMPLLVEAALVKGLTRRPVVEGIFIWRNR